MDEQMTNVGMDEQKTNFTVVDAVPPGGLRMAYVPIKLMPPGFWDQCSGVQQFAKKPRKVVGYRLQPRPDGCHNCSHRYCGMSDGIACGLACLHPENPCWCDSVDLLGICDSYSKDQTLDEFGFPKPSEPAVES